MPEDEMVGWPHRLNGQEFEKAPGVGDRQGSLACCSPWGFKESDRTEQLNNNNQLTRHGPVSGPLHGLFLSSEISPDFSVAPSSPPSFCTQMAL